ncbi:MAG: aldolase [Desulfovibrionaceae bacterium]|nr:aldolase [Desulfovibrionaceae bacterium]
MSEQRDAALIAEFVETGKSLYDRGYATGAAGNMSAVLGDGTVLATPSGSCMGRLDPATLSRVRMDGEQIAGLKATKEILFHLAIYRNNPALKAIVHLHSCYCTALACLDNLDPASVVRPITPYVVMRMGDIPLVPYYKPGSPKLAEELAALAPGRKAFLLANHGPITCGKDLTEAVNNAEEFEAAARIFFTLQGNRDHIRYLTSEEVAQLRK